VGPEVLATANVNIMVMCYVMPCNVVNRYQSLQLSALKMQAAVPFEIDTHPPKSTTIRSRRS